MTNDTGSPPPAVSGHVVLTNGDTMSFTAVRQPERHPVRGWVYLVRLPIMPQDCESLFIDYLPGQSSLCVELPLREGERVVRHSKPSDPLSPAERHRRHVAVTLVVVAVLIVTVVAGWLAGDMVDNQSRPAAVPAEATHIVSYRNARGAPDMVTFCLGPHGFYHTEGGAVKRLYELDDVCDPNARPAGP